MERAFVSPPRYHQTAGAMEHLGGHVERLGTTALLVVDESVCEVIIDTVDRSFSSAQSAYHVARFDGECTSAEVERLSEIARERGVDVVIGAGGGKAIDAGKAVRGAIDGALVSLPTIASTDAPTSGLSVMYTEDGRPAGGVVHDRRPDLVLVDSEIIVSAPPRWFVSGIGDALATRFEAAATAQSGGRTIAGGAPTQAGLALAERCYDVLREHAGDAVRAVDDEVVTDAVEATVEAIILLSGLGFENGGLAAAHAIHDGIVSAVDSPATHGEKVCFGLLTQLVLEGASTDRRRDITAFAIDVGLPVTLDGLGASPDDVERIARASFDDGASMGNQPGNPAPTDVVDALHTADEFGHTLL